MVWSLIMSLYFW